MIIYFIIGVLMAVGYTDNSEEFKESRFWEKIGFVFMAVILWPAMIGSTIAKIENIIDELWKAKGKE